MSLEFDVLKGKKLLLASASPRRRELLGKLDVAVSQAHLKQVDENYPTDMPAEDVPAYISQKKAAAYAGEICDDEILVAADTVVVCDGQVLGKPADAADAERMQETVGTQTFGGYRGDTHVAAQPTDFFRKD